MISWGMVWSVGESEYRSSKSKNSTSGLEGLMAFTTYMGPSGRHSV